MRGFEERRSGSSRSPLRYFVGGSGPPVVLVHGLGGAATNFTELAPKLAKRRRVLVPDLPGHGRSPPAPDLTGLTGLAGSVAELAESEGMLPAAVIGHSLGSEVSLRLAASRPDAVSALVLMASAGIACTTRRARLGVIAMSLLRPSRLAGRLRYPIARRARLRSLAFGWWGATDPSALTPEAALGFLDGPAHARDTRTAARALLAGDVRADLALVRCPSLVVWGARDRLTPLGDGFEYARTLGAPIRVVAAAGHLLPGERPDECADAIEQFLDRVGKLDELPAQAELVSEPRCEGADA